MPSMESRKILRVCRLRMAVGRLARESIGSFEGAGPQLADKASSDPKAIRAAVGVM